MAVAVAFEPKSYIADGSLSPRTIEWPLIAPADLIVTVDDVVRTLGLHYEVNGSYPSQQIVPLPGFATNGQAVRYRRATSARQDYSIIGQSLKRESLEGQLDRQAMVSQELAEAAMRTIRAAPGDPGLTLPRAELTAAAGLPLVLGISPLTGRIAILQAADFQGQPGGNAMAVGLWSSFALFDIATGYDLIQTSGFSTVGIGAARYVLDPDQTDAAPNAWRRQSANGRWFVLDKTQTVTLAMFGGSVAASDNSAAFVAAFAFGQPFRVEPHATPYRLVPDGANATYSIIVPDGAQVDASGATIHLDATGLDEQTRYAFWVASGAQRVSWKGGRFTKHGISDAYWIGGAGSCGTIRIDGVTDSTRGSVFFSTSIEEGVAVPISAVNATTGVFTVAGHGLNTGELISLYRHDGSNNLYIGLETHRDYYAIPIDAGTFRVAETETLALAGVAATFNTRDGLAPTRMRTGLVPTELLEISNYRCEGSGCGPHVFGMFKRVVIRALTGWTTSVQLFQFERPGGGNWQTWGFPFVTDVQDVSVEACGLGGIEWTNCHEIYARNIRVQKPNRQIDGTLWGYKPEAPLEPVAYAGVSVGAKTRVCEMESVFVEGAPYLPNTGPRAGWATPMDSAGIVFHQPGGIIMMKGVRGRGNSKADLEIYQSAGNGYTWRIRSGDRIGIRDADLKSATGLLVAEPNNLPVIDADASVDPFGSFFGSGQSRFLLPGWNSVGPDGAVASWFSLGTMSVDTADKPHGYGSVKYRGHGDEFAHLSLDLGDGFHQGAFVVIAALVKFNSAKFTAAAPPNFFAFWDDDGATIFPVLGASSGEFITDQWVTVRAILPSSGTSSKVLLYPNYGQDKPVVADPDWYVKFGGVWAWAASDCAAVPLIDTAQPMTTNGEPTLGIHAVGARFKLSGPAAGGHEGMICTTAGSPGTWKGYGAIEA
jgi:hypothetical protein